MPKRYLKAPAEKGLQTAELLAVRDMSSGKLKVVRPFTRGFAREAYEPKPDLALLAAVARKKRH